MIQNIHKEFGNVLKEEKEKWKYSNHPVKEVFLRLHKGPYAKYRFSEIELRWNNLKQNAYKHRKRGVMTKEDRMVFEIMDVLIDNNFKLSISAKNAESGSRSDIK